MTLSVTFLQEKAQQPDQAQNVAQALAALIQGATQSVHIAAYHFDLKDDALRAPVAAALRDAAARGVEVRIAYYFERKDNPEFNPHQFGGVVNPTGTEAFLGQVADNTNIELRAIHGSSLMHNKYVVVDGHGPGATLWTGSTNFTDGAWKFMENNIVHISSPQVCAFYENDFGELWANADIKGSGAGVLDTGTTALGDATVTVEFSPGRGRDMERLITGRIALAQNRIKVCSMVLSSEMILGALANAVGQVSAFSGIYDKNETEGPLKQSHNNNAQLLADIHNGLGSNFVAKDSRHFSPQEPDADYNYMHNKIVVCDDTVITGSFNFSKNATRNAENILVVESRAWADTFSAYIDQLVSLYASGE